MTAILLSLVLFQDFSVSPGFTVQPAGIPKGAKYHTYADAADAAARERKPLVVFVGLPVRAIDGAVSCHASKLDGYRDKCIVVAVPDSGWLVERAVLPANATDIAIFNATGQEVRRTPRPFLKRLFFDRGRQQTVDADGVAGGPWPEDVEFPEGLVLYRPAEWTQEIAVTNDRDRITPVHRRATDAKWHQPGGMLGLTGWRSDLYKLADKDPKRWIGDIPVLNSFGYFQNNRGHKRAYPSGATFFDILSNAETGKVFEARKASKEGGEWRREVVYRDVAEYPKGYAGLKGQTCHSCHSAAGTGGYAVGLVQGGDGVLSDPFPGLEQ